jgi:hypothetical protein
VTAATVSTADDDPQPKKPPKFCPWCGGEVEKCWVPNRIRSLYDRTGARVAYLCLACKIGVRAFTFPDRPLFKTKKTALADAQRDYDELEASGFSAKYLRDLYERGKCSCGLRLYKPSYEQLPCPKHNPLSKRSRA